MYLEQNNVQFCMITLLVGVVYDEMTASVNCDVEEEACSSNEKRWTDSRTDLIRNTPACIILP